MSISANQHQPRIWGVLPAAGIGKRMATHVPKQYLTVQGKSILEHSLQGLLTHPRIQKIAIILAEQDDYWSAIESNIPRNRILMASGGMERSHSVYSGLLALAPVAHPQDWVLVHDAVRPCVSSEDIERLIVEVEQQQAVGGLLALPVRDTLKITDATRRISRTLDRSGIWQAQTPQMFRLGELTQALQQVIHSQQSVTDEASAMELSGKQPIVVLGSTHNIKITHPDDLLWLKRYLREPLCV